ncbi:MAG: class I SAM-dependent methyltransferase [Actinobacteria bacterium]|nr:class I SAM-dependent methyltransferase [Actinomycetota bacterium]
MLARILEHYKVMGTKEKVKKIDEYLRLLSERREWAGLTSRGVSEDPVNAVVDSLGILSLLDSKEKRAVIDIGSGGGLVGVVISITCPDWEVVMAESSARKAVFLAEVIGSLGLGNAGVERERAENLSGRLMFDAAVGRAAGGLGSIAETALGLLLPGGLHIAIKGSRVENEVRNAIEAIEASGGELVGIEKPGYPDEFGIPDRVSLVVIRKI